jgi:hypothetical protein
VLVGNGCVDSLLTMTIDDQNSIKVNFASFIKLERNLVFRIFDDKGFGLGIWVKIDVIEDVLNQFHWNPSVFFICY